MTGLKMHWRLIQESDGRTHLNMQWEASHSGLSGPPSPIPKL